MSILNPTQEETAALIAVVERALPQGSLEARMALGLLVGQLVQREAAIEVLKRELALDSMSRVRGASESMPTQHGARCDCHHCHYRNKHPQLRVVPKENA